MKPLKWTRRRATYPQLNIVLSAQSIRIPLQEFQFGKPLTPLPLRVSQLPHFSTPNPTHQSINTANMYLPLLAGLALTLASLAASAPIAGLSLLSPFITRILFAYSNHIQMPYPVPPLPSGAPTPFSVSKAALLANVMLSAGKVMTLLVLASEMLSLRITLLVLAGEKLFPVKVWALLVLRSVMPFLSPSNNLPSAILPVAALPSASVMPTPRPSSRP